MNLTLTKLSINTLKYKLSSFNVRVSNARWSNKMDSNHELLLCKFLQISSTCSNHPDTCMWTHELCCRRKCFQIGKSKQISYFQTSVRYFTRHLFTMQLFLIFKRYQSLTHIVRFRSCSNLGVSLFARYLLALDVDRCSRARIKCS